MKGKVLTIAILACVLIFATISVASAQTSTPVIAPTTTSKYAKVVYIIMNGASATSATVYVSPQTPLPTYYYYFTTSNQRYIDILSDALGNNATIYFTGNKYTSSGTYRNAGTLINLREYRNQ